MEGMGSIKDFYNSYSQGFVRVAACTHHTTIGDPAANAESVLRLARQCHDDGVAVAIFPELTLSGYSIEDIVLQDLLLDDVEGAVTDIVASSADLLPVLVVGAPLRYRHRIYNAAVVIHRGAVLGVAPKSYLPTYREFYERRQIAPGDDERGIIRIGDIEAPFGPDLLFAASDLPDFVLHVEICEDMFVPIPPSAEAALAGATVLAQEEKRGIIRWLRSEYQSPDGAQVASTTQGALPIEPESPKASSAVAGAKRPWPKTLPEQAQAVRAVLADQSTGLTPGQLARLFFRANTQRVTDMLNTLVSLGQARALEGGRYVAT